MRIKSFLLILFLISISLQACKSKEHRGKRKSRGRRESKGSVDLEEKGSRKEKTES